MNTSSEEKLNSMILKWSLMAGVADLTPIIGADIAAIAGCQLKLFYDMAEHYEVQVTKERFTEVLATLATGVGGWAATIFGASKMIKAFPGIGNALLFWQPPVIAAFTWAMGQVLKTYFPLIKQGKTWDRKDMQTAMKTAWKEARKMKWKDELRKSVNMRSTGTS